MSKYHDPATGATYDSFSNAYNAYCQKQGYDCSVCPLSAQIEEGMDCADWVNANPDALVAAAGYNVVEEEPIEIPNKWKSGVITRKGLGLLSKLVKGHRLQITRAEIGTGWTAPEDLSALEAVTDPAQELTFSAVSYPEEGKSVIPVKLTNEEVTESYIGRQIGLYANDPDEGEILYYVTQVENEDGGTGIPSSTVIPSYSATWNLVIYYGMADSVDVTVDPAGSITQEEMEQYFEETVDEVFVPYTDAEIDALIGSYTPGEGGGGGGGTMDHSLLYNRDLPDAHPIEAITGLPDTLADLKEAAEEDGEVMTDSEVDTLWEDVMET